MMIKIDENYIDRFKKSGNEYLFYIINGIYLAFDENKKYIGLESFYNISNKNYLTLENRALNQLYKLGWIYDI